MPFTWCVIQHNTWEKSRSQEPVHLCDIYVPSCWDNKSGSGKTTASLSPNHPAQRNLHGYGRKLMEGGLMSRVGIKLAIIQYNLSSE